MRIGFFGGSFDPPHFGHLAIARAAAAAFSLDRTLFAPTANQPLKPNGANASFADRLAMVALLCASDPTFEPSALEAPRPNHSPNYTIDTLTHLRSTLTPADRIFVLAGADAFLDLRHWRAPAQLLTLADWIVISRPGFPFSLETFLDDNLAPLSLTPAQLPGIHLLNDIAEPASATHIRQLLLSGSDCANLLPPEILAYIRAHHIYGT